MIENLNALRGEDLFLMLLFGIHMRLFDSILIMNSRQGIDPSKHLQPVLFQSNGLKLRISIFDHLKI